MSFFSKVINTFKQGLQKTREVLVESASGLKSILLGRKLDDELILELERALIQADVGVPTTARLIDGIRADYKAGKMSKGEDVLEYLKREIKAMWPEQDRTLNWAKPTPEGVKVPMVILVTGVNGAGKTTSISKLCAMFRDQGKQVVLGACDTFRAGAVRQLEIWGDRLGVQVVKGQQGGDPAAVAFDACKAAVARGADVLIIDTAGRLHTQEPLMRQLTKIRSVVQRNIPGGQAPHETLLVLDATLGQNALLQAQEFAKALSGMTSAEGTGETASGGRAITGIFLAKLDGTAKGGIVIAIREVTKIPVKFVGVGETPADIEPFDPEAFVEAMFSV